jgi:hypothetical protein
VHKLLSDARQGMPDSTICVHDCHDISPEGKATAVCAHRAKGVGSLSFHVRLPASNRQASQSTCIATLNVLHKVLDRSICWNWCQARAKQAVPQTWPLNSDACGGLYKVAQTFLVEWSSTSRHANAHICLEFVCSLQGVHADSQMSQS